MLEYNPNLIKSVLLLVLAVSGNFVASTLSCQTQYALTNSMFAKNLVILFIIYFTLSFTSTTDAHPFEYLKNTLLIWFVFLLFTKQNIEFTMISGGLLALTYLIDSFVTHNNNKLENEIDENKKSEITKQNDAFKKFRQIIFYGGIFTIVLGYFIYMRAKYIEYKGNFNILSFIFGKVTCKGLA